MVGSIVGIAIGAVLLFSLATLKPWKEAGEGGTTSGYGQIWTITIENWYVETNPNCGIDAPVASLTVDGSGNFTNLSGSYWSGYTVWSSNTYNLDISISNGRMSGTSMTFGVNSRFSYGTMAGIGTGTLNASFPNATSASGTCSGTITFELTFGTKSFTFSWTARRVA